MVEILPELEPELEPEVEITVRALPEVGKVAILAVTLGMILAVDAIVRGFFGTLKGSVGWIPFASKVVAAPISKIEQKVVSFLGGLEHDIDSALGHAVHQTALLAEQLLHTLENTALELMIIGALAVGYTANVLLPKLERFVRGAIRKVEEEILHIERRVIREGAHITRVTVHSIIPRIQGAETTIKRLVEHEIRPIRETAKQAEKIAVRTEKKVEGLTHRLSHKAILAAVGAAIGTAALDALKCVNFGNLFKNRGCGLWKDLEDILGLLADLAAFSAICEVVPWLTGAFEDIATPFVEELAAATKKLCPEPSGWVQLNIANGPLPPPQTFDPKTL